MTRLYGPPASRILYYVRGGISFSRFCGVEGGERWDFIAQTLHTTLTVTKVADGHFGRCRFGTRYVSHRRFLHPGSTRLFVLRRLNLGNLFRVFVQYELTRCTIAFQFISIINLYMFRAGLLLIIMRYYSVCTAIDWLLAGSWSCQQPVNINAWHTCIPIAVV